MILFNFDAHWNYVSQFFFLEKALFVPPKNDWTLQSATNWNEGKSKHKRSDTWGHRKRHFNILQTEWISMRFSTGSYNIQVKGIRSCRQLKVVPKKYSRLSVRWILVHEKIQGFCLLATRCFAIACKNQDTLVSSFWQFQDDPMLWWFDYVYHWL